MKHTYLRSGSPVKREFAEAGDHVQDMGDWLRLYTLQPLIETADSRA